MDALLLSRIQFGFLISFHVLFPAFTIGLASWLGFVEWRWLRTRNPVWRDLFFFWQKIFAVSFGMGVVSGIVMAFQFGTNWPRLSQIAGTVIGPLLTYEVLTAFFLEASFLGVMMFGWGRVSPRLHFFSTCMVALGTLFSTFWILASNSWLHTPAGYEMINGVVHPVDWFEVVFNPSFPYRLAHMAIGSFITTCFVVGGVGAWYLRRKEHVEAGRKMLGAAVIFAAITVPVQIFVGDMHGLNTLKHQPMKIAAVEAHWHQGQEGEGVPLVVFAVPNEKEERNDLEIAIPRVGSLILTHSMDGTFAPLTSVPASERPPVTPVFFAFRIMVGIGTLMLLLAWLSAFTLARRKLFDSGALLRAWNWMLPSGFVALVAGWFVTEMGRQPWIVYGVLRTADAVGPQTAWMTAISLAVYVAGYAFVFGWGIWYLVKILRHGPHAQDGSPSLEGGDRTPARPISAADQSL
ncbi:TPA: cytochrome ubiquinol oxidase subunit I [Stenotrophomonas maltophilia]|jgi:cytochrome d ubiquinol oxidase subunit I|uniref:Cytochrome ubiquinol oxidase subunit I n=2 Tax=Stenotrophomonas TaxID=40323 RepID=A0A7W3FKH6_9GAMM|nr:MULTISPECIES: cytochrome ubiquinol oxidase subunit I [Stenotrophomonas]ELF4098476.1 cytochrome ubiquinol oxidase subunit I [Stenotrophomonas maltophilia]ELF4108235.1 cytochrome ubiquinol oxidase subunit I [Stenotrophomonas maltophilia]MBA0239177.1 cytochrome ubiquinol oxidase subunit I [Stenotrophomonas maltophilia]MBA0285553.1 cytochrome ubiquinol oxidase subunit I [Stenotrophomonas maltophilia]MBA0309965.1 cytochrome ubiquinol oxidase subunit I [Stenotrophomonas maltophilia]